MNGSPRPSSPALVQFPKIPGQAELIKQGVGFVHGSATPLSVAAVVIPFTRQRPAGCRRENRPAWQTPIAAPAVHHLFRPEEEHGLSTKDNIFPPSASGESEVNNALAS